jgi:hypothetical protein
MAERIVAPSVIERSIASIPRDVLNQITPFANRVEDLLSIPLDFPHGPLHIAEVRSLARQLCDDRKLGANLTERIDEEALYHDSGKVFEDLGLLEHKNHNVGSWFIANSLGYPKEFSWELLVHSKDKMPEFYPWSAFILRAADRAAGMGWSGVLRDAYYVGFRHPYFVEPLKYQKHLVDLTNVGDAKEVYVVRVDRHCFPWYAYDSLHSTSYERNVRVFFVNEVLPNLNKVQIWLLEKRLYTWSDRFEGSWLNDRVDGTVPGSITGAKYENSMTALNLIMRRR